MDLGVDIQYWESHLGDLQERAQLSSLPVLRSAPVLSPDAQRHLASKCLCCLTWEYKALPPGLQRDVLHQATAQKHYHF